MFGILISAFNSVLKYVFQTVIVKFVVFGALYMVVTGFISVIGDLMPTANPITATFAGLPPEIWYFLDVFGFDVGIPIIIMAHVTRFIIRRIPIIG